MPEVCDTVLDVVSGHRGVHGVDEQSEVLLRAIDLSPISYMRWAAIVPWPSSGQAAPQTPHPDHRGPRFDGRACVRDSAIWTSDLAARRDVAQKPAGRGCVMLLYDYIKRPRLAL